MDATTKVRVYRVMTLSNAQSETEKATERSG